MTMTKVPEAHNQIDDFLHGLEKLVSEHFVDKKNFYLCGTWVGPHPEDGGGTMIFGGHLIKVGGWKPDGMEFAKSKVAVASAALTITSLMPEGEDRKSAEQTVIRSLRTEL